MSLYLILENKSRLIYFYNPGTSQSTNNTWLTPINSLNNFWDSISKDNSSTTDFTSCLLSGGGTISNLTIGCTGNLGVNDINVQVWIDGTGTSLSCSMTGTQTFASDTVHTATLGPIPSRLSILCTSKNLSFRDEAPKNIPKHINMVPISGSVLYTPN